MAKKKNAADGVKKKPAQTNVQGLRAETVVIGNSKKMKSMLGLNPVSLKKNTEFTG